MQPYVALIGALLAAGSHHGGNQQARPAYVINQVVTNKKVVGLTFDDGPSKKWTPEILRVLKSDHVRATFFVIGSHAVRRPQLIREEVKSGMEIGSHGSQHLTLRNQSEQAIRTEIEDNAETLKALGAPAPTLYRLPGGISDRTALKVLGQFHYHLVGWTIDTRDWRRVYSAATMAKKVERSIEPGSIIIFHDGPNSSQQTVQAVKQIIPALRKMGYRFDTVGQMLKLEKQH